MLKLKLYLLEVFQKRWPKILGCFIYCILIMVINNQVNDNWSAIRSYSDGFFIGGFSLILIGFLSLINKAGGLDIFQYMFKAKKNENGSKETLYEYSERKRVVRSSDKGVSFPYFFVGILFLIVSIILLPFAA